MAKRRTRRRGNGEGSTYQRKDGLWCASLRVGEKRIVKYGRTQEEAQLKLDQLRGDIRRGGLPRTRSTTDIVTVGTWVGDMIADSEAPSTWKSQQCAFSKLEADLGHRPLHLVSATEIRECFRRLECGSRAKQVAYDVLKKAFKLAFLERRIDDNPMSFVKRPRHRPKPQRPFTVEEVGQILTAMRNHRLFGMLCLIFHLGLRQGEALGLRWDDIDWQAGVLRIRQGVARGYHNETIIRTLKTEASVRDVALTDDLLRVLLGRAISASHEGLAECDLVFPTRRGTPLSVRACLLIDAN